MAPRHPRFHRPQRGSDAPPAPDITVTASEDYPELYIDWMPDSGPNSANGEWVPLTSVTWEGTTKRGRQIEQDRFEAGTATLTIRTEDRRYDPENTAGPYFGKLTPMRQVRIRAKWAGVTYPVFFGYITSWGHTVPDDVMFVTTITVKDGFERLNQIKLPSSAWALEIQKDNPDAWFRLGESDTPRLTDSSPGGNYGVYDNCQQGVPGLVVNDADGGVAFAHSQEERVTIQNPDLITGYPFTVSGMFKIRSDPLSIPIVFNCYSDSPENFNDPGVTIYVSPSRSGRLGVAVGDAASNSRFAFTAVPVDDDAPHHFVGVWESASSFLVYLDGAISSGPVATNGTGLPSFPPSVPSGWTIGNVTDIAVGDYGFGTNRQLPQPPFADGEWYEIDERGTIDEVCVWNGTVVPAARAAAHALAALTGWADDDTGTRVDRFLDAIDWPAELRDIETGISILGPAKWSTGNSALSVLQAWADTELGQFFMGKDGKVVWRNRHYPLLNLASTRSQATFGDGHSSAELKYDNNGLDYERAETLIRNPVITSRENGVTVTVRDDDLIQNTYGDRSWSAPNSEDRDDATVRDRGMWLLARFKREQTRVKTLAFKPRKDPDRLWPQALDREIGERITIQRTPAGLDAEIVLDQIIEGIEHRFSPMSWQTTFRCSPVDPNVGSYLILDDDTYGLLDSGLLAY